TTQAAARYSLPAPPRDAPSLWLSRHSGHDPSPSKTARRRRRRYSRGGLLLRDAVYAPAPLNDIECLHLHDVPPRKAFGEYAASDIVMRIVKGRHDQRTIREVKVHIAGLQQSAGP